MNYIIWVSFNLLFSNSARELCFNTKTIQNYQLAFDTTTRLEQIDGDVEKICIILIFQAHENALVIVLTLQ